MTDGPSDNPDQMQLARAGLVLGLRQRGITHPELLRAFEAVPHELFVPEEYAEYAYRQGSLPIGCGQSITSPLILGELLAVLEPWGAGTILEIGTGSGYGTALLSRMARRVFSMERHGQLVRAALARWETLRISNIVVLHEDGLRGWPSRSAFDRILLTGSVSEVPEAVTNQLADDGVLVAAVGPPDGRQAILRIERADDEFIASEKGRIRLPPLASGKSRAF